VAGCAGDPPGLRAGCFRPCVAPWAWGPWRREAGRREGEPEPDCPGAAVTRRMDPMSNIGWPSLTHIWVVETQRNPCGQQWSRSGQQAAWGGGVDSGEGGHIIWSHGSLVEILMSVPIQASISKRPNHYLLLKMSLVSSKRFPVQVALDGNV